jgi:hypothetical protein
MSAHRYWRVYITANTGSSSFLDVRELEFRASIGGADQTGSGAGTAICSTADPSFPASSAFDNSNSTTWFTNIGTNHLPQWIGWDFGAGNSKDIVEFSLTCWAWNENPRDFLFQYSDDNSTWTTLYTIQGEMGWSASETRVYNATKGYEQGAAKSFWRVRSTAVDGSTVFGLTELEMWVSTAGGTNVCLGGTGYASTQQESGGPPARAVDGTKESSASTNYWSGNTVAEWVGCVFASGATHDIALIAITARASFQNQAPKNFVLEYWNGTGYTTAMTLTGITGWTSRQTRYFTASGEVGGFVAATARPVVFIAT